MEQIIVSFSLLCYRVQPPAVEKEEELKDLKDRAQVRMLLWLGLEKDQEKWTECCGGGEVAVFAETVSGVQYQYQFPAGFGLTPRTTCR